MRYITEQDFEYAVECRRYLHRHPETGFDLDNTVAFVRGELDKLGIAWGEAGPASVTGYIGPADAPYTIGIRADMDALPVLEKSGLPYASEIPGKMHACGHDSHTANLLTVARILKRHEAEMKVRVKLLFQPSEECEVSGAKSMVEHGAADDVDCVVMTHCSNKLTSGTIGYCIGPFCAACDPVNLVFKGKTAHATLPEQGVDAIAMAWEAYAALKQIAAEEAGADTRYIFGINYFHGGTAHNVVSDRCEMKITFRYYDMVFAARVRERCMAKCREIAAAFGGAAELDWTMSAPPLINDDAVMARLLPAIEAAAQGRMQAIPGEMGSEDFSWFLLKKPGAAMSFGTRNEAIGCDTAGHGNDFRIDERGMENAIETFVQFVMAE